jgi:hypothetical protein
MADAVVQARLRAGSLMHLGGTHLNLLVQGNGAVRHRRRTPLLCCCVLAYGPGFSNCGTSDVRYALPISQGRSLDHSP